MADLVFIQRSRLGRRIYELRESKLTVSGRLWFKVFDLHYISPEFVRIRRRMPRLIQIPLAKACVAGLLIRLLRFLPPDPYFVVVELAVGFIAISLWHAYRGLAPIEVAIFRNTNDRIQFDLVKEKNQGTEFEEFITALVASIDKARDLVTEHHEVELHSVSLRARRIPFWLLSLVCGGMALIWPLVNHFVYPLGPLLFPLTFLCTLGGLGSAVVSFSKTENLRFLSLIGAAIALAPPFIYRS